MADYGHGYSYSGALQEWQPAQASLASAPISKLSCLTWNVWFGDYAFAERANGLLAELGRRPADIIALQEVTPPLLRLLTERSWVRRDYTLSFHQPEAVEDHGLLLLSRRPPKRFRRLELPSQMGRCALLAEFETPQGTALVATVHLDSMSFLEQSRQEQLLKLFFELEGYAQVLLLGDFNFCSSWVHENDRLDSRYLDLWPHLRPGEHGYTEDTTINTMRLAQTRKTKHVRFDRILLRDDHRCWDPRSVELVGCRPLAPELFVSDHFGLRASLRCRESDGLLMLGRDHQTYGSFSQGALGDAAAFLSVGGDPQSPSMAYKANRDQPNEDALLVKRRDSLYLLAVSDAHYGIDSSHRLLERLAERDVPENRLDLLKVCLAIQTPQVDAGGAATLVVALYDAGSGQVIALSTGDSTLATLTPSEGWQVHNQHDSEYVRLDDVSYPDTWNEIELILQPGALLVLHTDGIDECHYRHPETSMRPEHITALWQGCQAEATEQRVRRFGAALTRAALTGVDGHPGGQDNIALVVIGHSLPLLQGY
jgi:tyrosyl-DNA phosphodiesterase 2